MKAATTHAGAAPAPVTAEAAVSAVEALELGAPFADPVAQATQAIDALEADARLALFPPIVPATADTIALFHFLEEGLTRPRYGEQLAELHRCGLAANPALAAFLRSEPVCVRVAGMAAGAGVAADAASLADAERQAIDRYQRAIARHLIGHGESDQAARIVADAGPALAARLEAAHARHRAHLEAELERVRQEEAAATAAIVAAEQQRRADVAGFFAARAGQGFVFRGALFSGQALAAMARREGTQDDSGEWVRAELPELERLMVAAQAAEAAVLG